jgi:hypothetical protein
MSAPFAATFRGTIMESTRSGGMTAVGIVNIVLGSLGAVVSTLIIIVGGALAIGGGQMESQLGAEAQGIGDMARAGGGMFAVAGFFGLVTSTVLGISGIAVLRMIPWARKVCIFCGGLLIALNGWNIVQGEFGPVTLGLIGYGAALIYLFFRPEWKQAFSSGGGLPALTQATEEPGQVRRAA